MSQPVRFSGWGVPRLRMKVRTTSDYLSGFFVPSRFKELP